MGGGAAGARPCNVGDDWSKEAKDLPFPWSPDCIMPLFNTCVPSCVFVLPLGVRNSCCHQALESEHAALARLLDISSYPPLPGAVLYRYCVGDLVLP